MSFLCFSKSEPHTPLVCGLLSCGNFQIADLRLTKHPSAELFRFAIEIAHLPSLVLHQSSHNVAD